VLDDFSSTKTADKQKPSTSTAPTATISGPPKPPTQGELGDLGDFDNDEFAKQLQASMANLLGGFESNPEMQKEFEAMMQQLGGAVDAAPPTTDPPSSSATTTTTATTAAAPPTVPTSQPASSSSSSTKKPAEPSFQDTIRKTMERMQTSGQTASAAASGPSSDPDEDMLVQMLKEMQSGDFGGADSEQDLNKLLMGMMEQLTNKDILYEPMKELHDKFPAWLDANRISCKKEDLDRYEEQKRVVDEIVARFERKEYSDESTADREYIVERMQKVCIPTSSSHRSPAHLPFETRRS